MKSILIPSDFGDLADRLVKAGLAFSRRMDARLLMLYSIEPVSAVTATPPYAVYETNKKQYKLEKQRALDKYASVFGRFKDKVPDESYLELIIEKGDRISNIISTVKELGVDLVILPGEHEGIMEKIMGESNNRVIQAVKVPVCVVPGEGMLPEPRRIGVLVEYSEKHFDAFSRVTDLVRQLDGTLVVLHPQGEDDFQSKLLFEGFKEESAVLTRDLEPIHIRFDSRNMAEQVGQLVRRNELDLLVVVNEDAHAIYSWFRHTTAERLLDKINVPMLVFPADGS